MHFANRGVEKKRGTSTSTDLKEKVLTKQKDEGGEKGFVQEKLNGKSSNGKKLIYFIMTRSLTLVISNYLETHQ